MKIAVYGDSYVSGLACYCQHDMQAINQVKAGKISAKEMCEKCYKRMAKVRDLNAFITETKQVATGLESSEQKHLSGLPIAVKDNFCTRGIRTSCGSKMLDNFIPPYTATVVQKLIDQGAVLAGKTNTDEFAMGCGSTDSFYGPVLNPWKFKFKHQHRKQINKERSNALDDENKETLGKDGHVNVLQDNLTESEVHIAGGSSGGSAVAVATGTCFGALGSDTGGSTRNPASYCGVVGLKPTFGLLSRHGLIPLVNSLDVPGIMAKTVEDAAIILNTVAGHDINDSTTVTDRFKPCDLDEDFSVRGLCVGIPKEYHAPGLSAEVKRAWSEAADMFENAGAKVVQVSLPHTQYSVVTYSVLCACEVASNMARYDGVEYGHRANNMQSTEDMYAQSRHEGFNDVVRGRIFAGNYFLLRENYEKHFLHALKVRRLISDDFKRVYQSGVDVLLTPTTLSDAPTYDWFIQADNRTRTSVQDIFTQPVNMAGIPAVNVPFKLSSKGLPMGLQIIGQNFKDHHMLNVARWLETQAKFPHLDLSFLDDF